MAQIYETRINPNWNRQIAMRADGVWFDRIVSRLRDDKPCSWTKSKDQNPMGQPGHKYEAVSGKKARLPKD